MFKFLPLASVVLFACSTPMDALDVSAIPGGNVQVTGQGVTVAQATVLLDETPGMLDLQVGTDQVILTTDGTPVSVEVGSVIVGKLGGGYLRHVVDIEEQGDRLVLRTIPADLSAAILHGNYHASAEVVERVATTWDLGNRVIYSGDVFSTAEGDYVNVDLFIADGASVTLDPTFDFDIELFNGNWIDAGFAADVELSYNADFVLNVDGAYDNKLEGTILTREIPFYFELGPVPVVGTATVEIVAGMEGDFQGSGTSTLHTQADVTAMLEAGYDDDGWYFDKAGDIDGDIGFTDTSFNQSISTRAWLRANITVELYGAAGAEIAVNPWLEVNSCMPAGVDVDGGLDGTQRYYFEALGWFDFDSGVKDFEFGPWDIYSYQCENGF